MNDEALSPRASSGAITSDAPSTPLDQKRRIALSYSAPSNRVTSDINGTTFLMSNSGGRHNRLLNQGNQQEGSLFEDEESVLVASPFAYVTPPMPPREQVSNAKTTKAMAKIVEDEGTPDSVIRKLAFGLVSTSNDSQGDDLVVPGTVNRGSRQKPERFDEEDEGFHFPLLSPPNVSDPIGCTENDSSPGEITRLSLSMVDLDPPNSPEPLRSAPVARAEMGDPCTVPDLLINCQVCGKQFISVISMKDHSQFCGSEGRGRVANSQASTLAQTTDTALGCMNWSVYGQSKDTTSSPKETDGYFADSPALPRYMQRALSGNLPAVQPLPLPASPSILASPTEVIKESDEDFLEEEISTFLDCLRGDVVPCSEAHWASRRAKIGRIKSEHSLCVSSEEDDLDASAVAVQPIGSSKTGLVLAPVAPPLVPMSSNIYSPIPHQRSSFDQETSMTTSFLVAPGPLGSPCSPIVAAKLPGVSESLEQLGRTSPTFGRLSMRSSLAPSVMDSAVTFGGIFRSSQRVACKCCGRKFATPSRLDRHEAVCEQVFGRAKVATHDDPVERLKNTLPESEPAQIASSMESNSCKYCGRNFSHRDKLQRHEHICLSVFKGRRRSKSPTASNTASDRSLSFRSTSADRSVEEPGTAVRRVRGRSRVTSFESVSIESAPSQSNSRKSLKIQQFASLVVLPTTSVKLAIGVQTLGAPDPPVPVKREVAQQHQRSVCSSQSSDSSLMSRSSLEFQYQLLREQIKTCSEKLKQRRSITHLAYRDA
jgi:hypothetical protein